MRQLRLLLVSLCLLGLTGCMSMRATSTLEADPKAATTTLAGLKFRIASVEAEGATAQAAGSVEKLQSTLQQHYPDLFNDDVDAIPLAVRMKSTPDTSFGPAFFILLITGTTIPFPSHEGFRMELEVTPGSAGGALMPAATTSYTRRDHSWLSVLSPLGLIPIPGRSDIERNTRIDAVAGAGTAYAARLAAFSEETLRKAVLTAVARLDQPALRRYQAQLGGKPAFEVDIEGRRFSARLLPGFTQGARLAGEADQYLLVLRHREERDGHVRTSTWQAPVARRTASGEWEVQRRYLMLSSRPLVATALLENGVPARGMVLPVEAPPLADFIDAPAMTPETAAPVRWSNNILLQIKNGPLAAELAAKPLPELRDLITRLESSLLDLNERVGRANDRAQQAIEKGESPDALRELAVVYRQRGEVLKAILQMVRQEAAGRGAP